MPSFGPPYIGEAHFRHRSTRHILQVSTVRHHRRCIRPSLCCGRGSTMADGGAFVCHRPSIHRRLTVVAFSFRRSVFACADSSLRGMASVLSIFACRRSHSAALRFTSSVCASDHPCLRSRERGTPQELIGTLPPYPLSRYMNIFHWIASLIAVFCFYF